MAKTIIVQLNKDLTTEKNLVQNFLLELICFSIINIVRLCQNFPSKWRSKILIQGKKSQKTAKSTNFHGLTLKAEYQEKTAY